MEVHHQPKIEKKYFKEYFLELLMIFLAVPLGFFAESYRQHIVKDEKERHLMEMLVEDLKSDTSEILLKQKSVPLTLCGSLFTRRDLKTRLLACLRKCILFSENMVRTGAIM